MLVSESVDLADQVPAQPGHCPELHPVGLFVEAHPQPEVGRVDAELALGRDDVGCHEQEPPRALLAGGEHLELAEHLRRQPREHGPELEGCHASTDGRDGAARITTSEQAVLHGFDRPPGTPRRWRAIHAGRSTTSTGAPATGASSPV